MRGWLLLWVAFAAIVVGAGGVLLRACGLAAGMDWRFCPTVASPFDQELDREAELRRQVAQLVLEIARRRLDCGAAPAPPPAFEWPQHAGEPRPQQTAEKKIDLPQDRWDKKDLGLLEGCWRLGSDAEVCQDEKLCMIDGKMRCCSEPCRVPASTLCFGEDGKGHMEWQAQCTTKSFACKAPADAQYAEDGTLRVSLQLGQCNNGSRSLQGSYICRRSGSNVALCKKIELGGGAGDMEFRR